jgi:hypothetical protein
LQHQGLSLIISMVSQRNEVASLVKKNIVPQLTRCRLYAKLVAQGFYIHTPDLKWDGVLCA